MLSYRENKKICGKLVQFYVNFETILLALEKEILNVEANSVFVV